ncbi:hypothetical protein Pfo_006917 [Paulownia fortunei]|nr:hypothetical protein Pfo_006917 [Paulownia fortunei]
MLMYKGISKDIRWLIEAKVRVGMTIGDELKVSHIQDRMPNMLNNADAFIILPDSFGTLEELFQIVSWAQLNIHQKPIGILNVNGFYDGLLSFVDHAAKKGLFQLLREESSFLLQHLTS